SIAPWYSPRQASAKASQSAVTPSGLRTCSESRAMLVRQSTSVPKTSNSNALGSLDMILHRERLALLGHDHFGGVPLHLSDEFVGVRFDDRERAIVARHDGVELEEALDRERGGRGAHGEAIADRHHGHFGLMDFRDQRHVGENVGVAHVVDGGLAFGLD